MFTYRHRFLTRHIEDRNKRGNSNKVRGIIVAVFAKVGRASIVFERKSESDHRTKNAERRTGGNKKAVYWKKLGLTLSIGKTICVHYLENGKDLVRTGMTTRAL